MLKYIKQLLTKNVVFKQMDNSTVMQIVPFTSVGIDAENFVFIVTCHDECSTKEKIVFLDKGICNIPQFYTQYNCNKLLNAPIQIKIDKYCKIMLDGWDGSKYSGTLSSLKIIVGFLGLLNNIYAPTFKYECLLKVE